MPGTNYGPTKITAPKMGKPSKMINSPDVAKPEDKPSKNPFSKIVKKIKRMGPGSRTDGVKNGDTDDKPLKPVKPRIGLKGLSTGSYGWKPLP